MAIAARRDGEAEANGKMRRPRSPGVILSEPDAGIAGPPRILDQLAPAEVELLLAQGKRRVVKRGELLFAQGEAHDGIFLVESGSIRVFYAATSGREITLAYWHPGNFVGGPEVFGGTHVWSGVAVRTSSVLMLPGKTLRALIPRLPNLALWIIDGLVFKGRCYSALAQVLGTRSVFERLQRLLLHLAELHGVAEGGGLLIGAVFTHQDLAHMVGGTRQWVTACLNRLEADGIIRLNRGRITLLDLERLARPGKGR